MQTPKITRATKKFNETFVDEILAKIKGLEIDDETYEKIEKTLKNNKKRKAPVIPKEKQCNQKTKSGEKCVVARCIKNKCWAHMTKEERIEYKAKKAEE